MAGTRSSYLPYVAVNVELIGPTLMLEYVTDAEADLLSTSVGTPEEVAQEPRADPSLCRLMLAMFSKKDERSGV